MFAIAPSLDWYGASQGNELFRSKKQWGMDGMVVDWAKRRQKDFLAN